MEKFLGFSPIGMDLDKIISKGAYSTEVEIEYNDKVYHWDVYAEIFFDENWCPVINDNLTDKLKNVLTEKIKNPFQKLKSIIPEKAIRGRISILYKDEVYYWDIYKGCFVDDCNWPVSYGYDNYKLERKLEDLLEKHLFGQ